MTPADPVRRIEAVGERLLDTARPLVAVPALLSPPNACANLLLDPLDVLSDVLSDVCDAPLETPDPPTAPGPPITRTTTQQPPYDAQIPPPERQTTPGHPVDHPPIPRPDRPPSIGRRSRGAGSPSRRGPENPAGAPGSPRYRTATPPGGPARSNAGSEPPVQGLDPRQEHGLGAYPNPRDDEPAGAHELLYAEAPPFPARDGYPESPETAWPAGPPERREKGGGGRPDGEFRHRSASDLPERTGRMAAGGTSARAGVRLVPDAGRLGAVLRANATTPPGSEPEDATGLRERAGHVPPAGSEPRGRGEVGVEDVLEELAEELETAFARTYGSSGV